MGSIDLDTLVGPTWDFYGVDNNFFKLDGFVYEAMEDADDGYRSCLAEVRVANDNDAYRPTFFTQPIAQVRVRPIAAADTSGHELVDASGHVWLQIGTSDVNDYYPCFLFHYDPKQP